ncbi:MAG: glutamate 5-kinase [Chlamydiales bacterium]|nr:glutamate 5-kinase [Chlamydiales bacterium]
MDRRQLVVVKIGTSTLTGRTKELSRRQMLLVTTQVAALHEQGHRVIIVTSGSVAAGREALGHQKYAATLPAKQMLSSIGQVRLMHAWSELFAIYGITVGQLLLSRGDFANRRHYLNIRDTFWALLNNGVVPIINENDPVATEELRFGDNDNLAALVANLVAADLLVIITDQSGLYTADPSRDPEAKLISVVHEIDESILSSAGSASSSAQGTGGMFTKLQAARLATESGTTAIIASLKERDVLQRLVGGEPIGTRFTTSTTPLESRKRWLLSERVQGTVTVDAGAKKQILEKGASLLPVGVIDCEGDFERGAIIGVKEQEGLAFATGISNYSSSEVRKLYKARSDDIEKLLGYSLGDELIHRDNLVAKSKSR